MYRSTPYELYLPEWVVEGVMARAQRPGYPADRPSVERIQEWVEVVARMDIKSVLCILDRPQIAHYSHVRLEGGGLFAFYETLGLNVAHVPANDHKRPPLSDKELDAVWDAYEKLEKPVLIHCSAGRDRTGAAIELILWKTGENFDTDVM
jgi:protein-tyrosine phosphatase